MVEDKQKTVEIEESRRSDSERDEMQSADATAVRNAPVKDLKEAQDANKNKSDGSFHYDPSKASIEIVAYSDDGRHLKKTDRKQQHSEHELMRLTHESSHSGSADAVESKSDKKEVKAIKREQISRTGVQIAIEAEHNPALEPVAELRAYADKLPDSERKQKLIELSREQAMELSPAIKGRIEGERAQESQSGKISEPIETTAQVVKPEVSSFGQSIAETHVLSPEVNQQDTPKVIEGKVDDVSFVLSEFPKLPLDQKLKITQVAGDVFYTSLRDGLGSNFSAMGEEMFKGATRAAVNLVNFGLEAGSLSWEMYNIPDKLGEMAIYSAMGDYKHADELRQESADTVGRALAFSLAPLKAGYDYGYQWGYSGDPAKPIKDIVALKESWDKLTPAQQAGLATEIFICWELPAKGMRLAETGQFAEAFTHMNNARKTMTSAQIASACERTQLKIAEFMKKVGLSGNGTGQLAWETAGVEGGGKPFKITEFGKTFENPLDELTMKMSPLFEFGKKASITFKQAAIKIGKSEQEIKQMIKSPEGLKELEGYGIEYTPREYHEEFMRAHPEYWGYEHLFEVHHSIPQEVLERFPGMFKATEINGLDNLRGIPRELTITVKGKQMPVHQFVTEAWGKFFRKANPTRANIENFARGLDKRFGNGYTPEVK